MQDLWTPMEVPTKRKADGGSHFDDEMRTKTEAARAYALQAKQFLEHLNARPDHVVYVGSTIDRDNLRKVFNHWKSEGAIGHHPNIRIDYGVADGAIRVGD